MKKALAWKGLIARVTIFWSLCWNIQGETILDKGLNLDHCFLHDWLGRREEFAKLGLIPFKYCLIFMETSLMRVT